MTTRALDRDLDLSASRTPSPPSAASLPSAASPPSVETLARVLHDIRQDGRRDAARFLDETVTPHGGE